MLNPVWAGVRPLQLPACLQIDAKAEQRHDPQGVGVAQHLGPEEDRSEGLGHGEAPGAH